MKKKVLLISTGGTIASLPTEHGLMPALSSEELLQYVNLIEAPLLVDCRSILDIDSTDLSPEHWKLMVKTVEENYYSYDGFVITHGTDTLAYTAAALSYMIQDSPKPIVLTGAQRSIHHDITDAKTNLMDALIYASSEQSHNVNIVFNGKVIAGTRGRKERTKSFDAFTSINYPFLALVREGRILRYIDDFNPRHRVKFYYDMSPSVFLLKLIPGLRPDILPMIFENYEAIIMESYGVGGIPGLLLEEIKRLMAEYEGRRILLITTQVPQEGSDLMVYEVGQRIKKSQWMLESYDMTLEATITKLMWAMGVSEHPSEVSQYFHRRINHDLLQNEL